MTKIARNIRGTAGLAAALLCGGQALATENGGNSYPLGVETIFSGLMPPEGFHMYAYYAHYESEHNQDNTGNDNPRFAYYKLKTDTVSLRFDYVYPGVQWLGATVETRVAIPLPTIDAHLGIARPAALGTLDRSEKRTNFGDPQVAPILLGWHNGGIHQTAGIETFVPLGAYNPNDSVNTGRNYFQFAPIYAITWLPGYGLQGDFKIRYGINTKNQDTNYKSGQELTIEYSAGYRVHPDVVVGVNGYAYQQTTNDEQNHVVVAGNGNRGRVLSAGPFLAYSFTPKFSVIAKAQTEWDVRNRPKGTRVWLQTKVPF